MQAVRSHLFNLAFYASVALWQVLSLFGYVLPRRLFMRTVQAWCWSSLWLARVMVGIRVEFRGRENLPQGGYLVASKHQSVWETFALVAQFDDPSFILKRELMWLPFFGWMARKMRLIAVDRGGGAAALAAMTRTAQEEIADGRQIVIFPEGTRRPAGAEPAYKFGVAHLYESLKVPCVPVALNSGLYWPRRTILRRPGTIVVEYLPPIPPGLSRTTFFRTLQAQIEGASRRLLEEGRRELGEAEPVPAAPERASEGRPERPAAK